MTVTEYFQKAKEDGYDWAQAALDNFNSMTSFEDDVDVETLHEAIDCGFVWSDTPQGYAHWDKVWQEVYTERKKV